MLTIRFLTGSILTALFLVLLFKGGTTFFSVLIAGAIGIGSWELFVMLKKVYPKISVILGVVCSVGMCLIFFIINKCGLSKQLLNAVLVGVFMIAFLSEVLIKRNTSLDNAPLLFFGGVFYTGFLLSHAIHIRFLPEGDKYIILLVTLVCGGDIGAYFAGNYLGKHKLLPKISPKKTFEGALGGLVTSIGIGICIKLWLLPQFTFLQILVIGTLLGVVGQIGDLIESILKRWIGVKDSGYIIPGHGGFLDVVDSLILATPFFYYYLIYFK